MKRIAFLLICSSLFLVSCGTKKPADDKASKDESSMDSGKGDGLTLELNGDSDSNTAGALSTVYFDYDSSSLTGNSKKTLEANATYLKANEKIDIQVEGHCDERGGIQYNLALGERRARSVKDYLVALGVKSSRVKIVSMGKEKPIAFGHDDESWSKNRRGNFVITAK